MSSSERLSCSSGTDCYVLITGVSVSMASLYSESELMRSNPEEASWSRSAEGVAWGAFLFLFYPSYLLIYFYLLKLLLSTHSNDVLF